MKFSTRFAPVLLAAALAAQSPDASYKVDTISTPPHLDPQVGGIACFDDGRVAVCFHRGEVYVHDPKQESWTLFADGLHEPLGVVIEDERTLVVMQRPELTRLRDEDGDGRADSYETVCDAFGMSGNYHEFAFGPTRGPDGRYYVGLNVASNGAGIRDEVRGEFRQMGRPGRMYSCVPYRGWVIAIDPETGAMEPYASGFRSPDGISWGPDGNLWASDNQGDWLGTSKLFRVEKGGFHGHVSSLIWTEGWDRGDPLNLPLEELDVLRVRASVLFPQGIVANSPTQHCWIPDEPRYGALAGQMLVGEMNTSKILRILHDEVGGFLQGAAVTFLDSADAPDLPGGVHRMAFDPAGRLWTGHTALSWAGGNGIRRITFPAVMPMEVVSMQLREDGLALRFSHPLAAGAEPAPGDVALRSYWFNYHRPYGSDRMGEQAVAVAAVRVDDDRRGLFLELGGLRGGRVYELTLPELKAANGLKLTHGLIAYNLVVLPDGTLERPQFEPAEPAWQPDDAEPIALGGEPLTLQVEAAQAIVGAQVHNQHQGHRGSGYVDYQGPGDEFVAWKLAVAKAGRYRLQVRYALGGGTRQLVVQNGEQRLGRPLDCTSTGDWQSWGEVDTELRLPAGEIDLRLVAPGGVAPNVDEITLTRR